MFFLFLEFLRASVYDLICLCLIIGFVYFLTIELHCDFGTKIQYMVTCQRKQNRIKDSNRCQNKKRIHHTYAEGDQVTLENPEKNYPAY